MLAALADGEHCGPANASAPLHERRRHEFTPEVQLLCGELGHVSASSALIISPSGDRPASASRPTLVK
jgi:hypothetical protein